MELMIYTFFNFFVTVILICSLEFGPVWRYFSCRDPHLTPAYVCFSKFRVNQEKAVFIYIYSPKVSVNFEGKWLYFEALILVLC